MAGALAFAKSKWPIRAPAALRCADLKVTHPNPDAYFQFARNTVARMAKTRRYPAPLRCVDVLSRPR